MNAILNPATDALEDGLDIERELHIEACGLQMLAAYARYEDSGDLQDRADADRWCLMQAEAIRGRSAAMVARMEAERALA